MTNVTDYGSLVEQINPIPMDLLEIQVTVNPDSELLIEYARSLYLEIEAELAKSGGRDVVSKEDITAYVQWLIVQRTNWVNGGKFEAHPKSQEFFVPSYVSVVMANIGNAVDKDRNLFMVPTLPKDYKVEINDKVFSREDAKRVSNHLTSWRSAGMEGSHGYEANKDGSFEFMTFCVMEDQVMRFYGDAHPTYALLAATVALKGVEATLVPRIKYGSTDSYKRYMSKLAEFKQ
jgi:hypothetical protein